MMSLVIVKGPTPFRTLNILDKSFHFNKDCLCNIPEEYTEGLNGVYSIIGKVEKVEEKKIEKIIKEEPKEIKKVIKKDGKKFKKG